MAFGFPPRVAQTHTYTNMQSDLITAVKTTLDTLHWPYELEWGKEFRVKPERSYYTWGEKMRVTVSEDGKVFAESWCEGRRFQIFDFGINQQHIDKFFAELNETLELR